MVHVIGHWKLTLKRAIELILVGTKYQPKIDHILVHLKNHLTGLGHNLMDLAVWSS